MRSCPEIPTTKALRDVNSPRMVRATDPPYPPFGWQIRKRNTSDAAQPKSQLILFFHSRRDMGATDKIHCWRIQFTIATYAFRSGAIRYRPAASCNGVE